MTHQKQKSPNRAETGFSENIHLLQANNSYFNMILDNEECALFCCDVLRHFDDLLNKHVIGRPYIAPKDRIAFYLQLSMTNKEDKQ